MPPPAHGATTRKQRIQLRHCPEHRRNPSSPREHPHDPDLHRTRFENPLAHHGSARPSGRHQRCHYVPRIYARDLCMDSASVHPPSQKRSRRRPLIACATRPSHRRGLRRLAAENHHQHDCAHRARHKRDRYASANAAGVLHADPRRPSAPVLTPKPGSAHQSPAHPLLLRRHSGLAPCHRRTAAPNHRRGRHRPRLRAIAAVRIPRYAWTFRCRNSSTIPPRSARRP